MCLLGASYTMGKKIKKDKNKSNNAKKSDNPGFKESIAEQKCAWVAKMDPYSDEAVQLYESLKEEGVVNQSALRLARIAGKNVCSDVILKQQLIFS